MVVLFGSRVWVWLSEQVTNYSIFNNVITYDFFHTSDQRKLSKSYQRVNDREMSSCLVGPIITWKPGKNTYSIRICTGIACICAMDTEFGPKDLRSLTRYAWSVEMNRHRRTKLSYIRIRNILAPSEDFLID